MIKLANSNYTRIRFGSGPLTAEKLNRMVDNMDYLYERMARGGYYVNGFNKDTSVRIQGFVAYATTNINNVSRWNNVYFTRPFTTGCIPVITNGHYYTEALIHSIGFKGLNGGVWPTNMGFRLEVFAPTTEYGDEWRGEHIYPIIALGY